MKVPPSNGGRSAAPKPPASVKAEQSQRKGSRLDGYESDDNSLHRRSRKFIPWADRALSQLYKGSITLRSVPDSSLRDPLALVDELVQRRASIQEEIGADVALGTLVQALATSGRMGADTQLHERLAGARDLYDRSPILQGISDALQGGTFMPILGASPVAIPSSTS